VPQRILDLCSGSGCIGIEAAHQFPEAQVDLVDISEQALQVATLNANLHGVSDRIRCIQSDGFSALAGQQYDLILLNPPYVSAAELDDMPAEYQHEPRLALASGVDGMALTQRLLGEVAHHLTRKGLLFLEVGYSADTLAAIFPEFPFVWLEFAHGGEGVTVLTAQDCRYFRDLVTD
jgi:ribosomal protein L3 glutamine methyltransferase